MNRLSDRFFVVLTLSATLIILAMLFVAAFAERLAPYDPYHGDYAMQFKPPSAEHCPRSSS